MERLAWGVLLPEPSHSGIKSNPLGFYTDVFVKVTSITLHLTICYIFIYYFKILR